VQYNRQFMQAILHGRLNIAEIVNAQVISLEDAAQYRSIPKSALMAMAMRAESTLNAGYELTRSGLRPTKSSRCSTTACATSSFN
jgi:hypothetical protein